MAELPGTKDSPLREAQLQGVLESIRAKNEHATLPGVIKGQSGVAEPDEAELPGADEDPRRSRLPGQSYFENPEDFDVDPTLTSRQNEVKSVLGVVCEDSKLKKFAYAQNINGMRMVEFQNGLYVMDRGEEMEFNIDLSTQDTDVTTEMIVDKAIKKGWKSIEFEGQQEVGDALWLECARRGMPLEGHVPSALALRIAATDPDVQQGLGMTGGETQPGGPLVDGGQLEDRNMEDGPADSRFGDDMTAAGDHRVQGMETADRSGATTPAEPANDGKLLDKFDDPAKGMRDRDEDKRMTI